MLRALAGVVALHNGACRNATAHDNGTTEGHPRIDHDDPRLIDMTRTRKREQSRRDARRVVLDSLEVSFEGFPERDLAAGRSDDQLPELFDKQVDAVGLELLCRERVPATELAT